MIIKTKHEFRKRIIDIINVIERWLIALHLMIPIIYPTEIRSVDSNTYHITAIFTPNRKNRKRHSINEYLPIPPKIA
jgi:hypothetical protein